MKKVELIVIIGIVFLLGACAATPPEKIEGPSEEVIVVDQEGIIEDSIVEEDSIIAEETIVYDIQAIKDSMYGSPRVIPEVAQSIELNVNMSPFIHEHEEGVKPNGVSDETPWKYGTIIKEDVKSNWSRVGLWGQVYLQEGYTNIPSNAAIELRNFEMYIFNPVTLEWEQIFDLKFDDYNTLFYDDNYENNKHQQFYTHKKILNNGDSVIIRFDDLNANFNFHPYSHERFEYMANGYGVDGNIPYVISKLEARLVKWDENGVDDLDEAQYIFNVGGDYWDTYQHTWTEDWYANGEIGGGQFQKVTRDWDVAWFTNVPEALCDELILDLFSKVISPID